MRKPAPEKDRSERYLLTYSDLMNLLLILFIILFSTSTKDVVKQTEAMNAIAESFGGGSKATSATPSGGGNTSSGTSSSKSSTTSDYSDFYNQLYGLFKGKGMLDKVDIAQQRDEVIITLKDNVLFHPGKADLSPDATNLLSTMGGLLTKIKYGQIQIEGHTDSDPLSSTSQFRDNRELSLIRAYNVYNVFKSNGVNPATMQPIGYGEFKPVIDNNTVEHKAQNRRVVITIMGKGLTPSDETLSTSQLYQKQQESIKAASSKAAADAKAASSKTTSSKTTSSAKTSSK